MRILHPLVVLSAFMLSACEGPVAVFPGGALGGPVKPVPQSFAFASDAGTIQLETHPEDPYSVNIACAVVGDELYISAGDNKSRWVENMEANPLVRLRIDGDIYELRAHRVTGDIEMRAFADEWTKNAWARDPTTLDEVWVYRLAARVPDAE
ncbi:MAG: nitroreductase family deazaflavin-dependent oxidoreductase [bacterium]|nr:nitroreductase family deazaflavin-dependent oxidoreductase [bacterium]